MENAPNARRRRAGILGLLQKSAEVDEKEGDAVRSGVGKCAKSGAREGSGLALRPTARRGGAEGAEQAGRGVRVQAGVEWAALVRQRTDTDQTCSSRCTN